MIENKFVIVTTCYNVMPYIEMNHYMNKFQSYKNFIVLYVDDGSTDGTYEFLKEQLVDETNFFIYRNPNGGSQGKAYMAGIDYLENNNLISDEDIIVEVDGDDWLSSTFVLQYLNQVYQNPNIWMSHGQYQIWPDGNIGGHYHLNIDETVDKHNLYRRAVFPYSHLKTYKYWLFDRVDRKDLIDPTTGEFWDITWDFAVCMPQVEMAGKSRIYRCEEVMYIYNQSPHLNNESKTKLHHQKYIEQQIRNLKPYERLLRK